jgi:DNA-binding CsgD family transcriptional regulator
LPNPGSARIVLTTFHADEQVLRALRAGAGGFLLKDTRPAEILRAISRVAAGEPILSPAVTRQLIAHVGTTGGDARRRNAQAALAGLSEREVAAAVGRGRSNAQISMELFMSVATVKAHVSSILLKLDLNNRPVSGWSPPGGGPHTVSRSARRGWYIRCRRPNRPNARRCWAPSASPGRRSRRNSRNPWCGWILAVPGRPRPRWGCRRWCT